MHVPIHKEMEISVYKHWEIPSLQLYKNSDDAFEAKQELESLSTTFDGVFLTSSLDYPRDERNLETISNIAPTNEGFLLFAPPLKSPNKNHVVLCNYLKTSSDELRDYKQQGIRTTITLDDSDASSDEPFEVANRIATLMDESGGGDFIFVSSPDGDDDDTLRLCEELSYLDVPGPIMKSRLMLDCPAETTSEDLVDEVMSLGVNKFVVYKESQVQDCIQEVALEQGKQMVK